VAAAQHGWQDNEDPLPALRFLSDEVLLTADILKPGAPAAAPIVEQTRLSHDGAASSRSATTRLLGARLLGQNSRGLLGKAPFGNSKSDFSYAAAPGGRI
jgi:hypothetical protein